MSRNDVEQVLADLLAELGEEALPALRAWMGRNPAQGFDFIHNAQLMGPWHRGAGGVLQRAQAMPRVPGWGGVSILSHEGQFMVSGLRVLDGQDFPTEDAGRAAADRELQTSGFVLAEPFPTDRSTERSSWGRSFDGFPRNRWINLDGDRLAVVAVDRHFGVEGGHTWHHAGTEAEAPCVHRMQLWVDPYAPSAWISAPCAHNVVLVSGRISTANLVTALRYRTQYDIAADHDYGRPLAHHHRRYRLFPLESLVGRRSHAIPGNDNQPCFHQPRAASHIASRLITAPCAYGFVGAPEGIEDEEVLARLDWLLRSAEAPEDWVEGAP